MGNKLDVPKHLKRQERRRSIKLDKDFRRTVKKFSEMEMEYLTRVFEELARKVEPVDSIDKDTFMSFFPLPGLFGERLFSVLQTHGDESNISFRNFISVIATMSKGSNEEKIHFLFEIFDLNGDSVVSKEELTVMLHHVPSHVMSSLDVPKDAATNRENIKVTNLEMSEHKLPESNASSGNKDDNDDAENFLGSVHGIASSIFKLLSLSESDGLQYDHFRALIMRMPSVLHFVASVFPYNEQMGKIDGDSNDKTVVIDSIGTSDKGSAREAAVLSPKNHRRRSIPRYNRLTSSSSMSIDDPTASKDVISTKSFTEKEGTLHKKNRTLKGFFTKRYYCLCNNLLYYYVDKSNETTPKGVIFLESCFVEIIDDDETERARGYFGFRIVPCRLRGRASAAGLASDSEEDRAVKITDKNALSPQELLLLRSEIAVLRLINHPNIVRLFDVFETPESIYIVMELVEGGELYDRIIGHSRFSEVDCFAVVQPILKGVVYLHSRGIVHRDLKPENILCGNELSDIKIADFGLSRFVLPAERIKVPCGTLTYLAPEVISDNGYGKGADLWSIGVMAFLMLRGKLPFTGSSKAEIVANMRAVSVLCLDDDVWVKISPDARNFVADLLKRDPIKRVTGEDALAHPWMCRMRALNRAQRKKNLFLRPTGLFRNKSSPH
eukprot:g740.t1